MSEDEIAELSDGAVLRAPNGDTLTMDRYGPRPCFRVSDGSYLFVYNVRLEYNLAELQREDRTEPSRQ
jgi:hypothetical protein